MNADFHKLISVTVASRFRGSARPKSYLTGRHINRRVSIATHLASVVLALAKTMGWEPVDQKRKAQSIGPTVFSKKKPDPGPAPQLVERWKAIASKPAPGTYEDAPNNHRAPRSAVFRQAVATLEGGEQIPVAIKNLSTTGCRIEFFTKTLLTPTLVLDEQSMSLHFRAEVRWQGEGAAGLRFIDAE